MWLSSIKNFLQLFFLESTTFTCLMDLHFATLFNPIQNLIQIHFCVTARISINTFSWICKVDLQLWLPRVVLAVPQLTQRVKLLASTTFKSIKLSPHFPINLLPGNSVSLSDVSYKLLEVPILVYHVFSSHLSLSVDEWLARLTSKVLALVISEEFLAICTFL